MSATAEFLQRWRSLSRNARVLVEMELPSNGDGNARAGTATANLRIYNGVTTNTIAVSDVTPMSQRAIDATAAINASFAVSTFKVVWGFRIVAGFNDSITFAANLNAVATNVSATVPAGDYASGAALAAAVQTAMQTAENAFGGGKRVDIVVTYSEQTGKFTFAWTQVRATVTQFIVRGVVTYTTSILPTLGVQMGSDLTTSQSSVVAPYEVRAKRFVFAFAGAAGGVQLADAGFTAQSMFGITDTANATIGSYLANSVTTGTTTLRIAQDMLVAGDRTWEPLLADANPVRDQGQFGMFGVELATCSLKIANKHSSALGQVVGESLASHRWVGGSASIYLWEMGLTDFADALPMLLRSTIVSASVDKDAVRVDVRQRTDWNRPLPPTSIDGSAYPRSLEGSRGAPIPLVYGRVAPESPLRPPWTTPFNVQQRRLTSLKPTQLSRMALVDTGRGGASKAKVLVAGHGISNIFDPNSGTALWYDIDDWTTFLLNSDPGDVVNSATESGVVYGDKPSACLVVPLGQIDDTVPNPPDGAAYLLDPDGVAHARFDYGDLKRDVKCFLAGRLLADILGGENVGAEIVVGYQASTAQLQIVWGNPEVLGMPSQTFGPLSIATTPTVTTLALHPNTFPASDTSKQSIRATMLASGFARVYFMLLAIFVKPTRRGATVKGGITLKTTEMRRRTIRGRPVHDRHPMAFYPYDVVTNVPPITELRSDHYANVHGKAATSTQPTDVNGALIERGPDVFADLLNAYGLQGYSSKIQVDGRGGYRTARAYMKTARKADSIFGLTLSETADVGEVLAWLGNSMLATPILSRVDDVWRLVPMYLGAQPDYDIALSLEHMNEPPDAEMTPLPAIVTSVRVGYGWDAREEGLVKQVAVGPSISSAGYAYRNLRDQDMTIVANVNDRLDFIGVLGTAAATLTPGRYADGGLLAQHVQVRMNAAHAFASKELYCAYAGTITAGHNDKLDFSDGVAKVATLRAGVYSMEDLATEVARALNAGSSGWSCSYSRTTRKFTIGRSSGTAILTVLSGNPASALPTLGFRPALKTGSLSYAADMAVEEGSFVLAMWADVGGQDWLDLAWATGANAARSCAALLGFDGRMDAKGFAETIHVSACRKGTREYAMADAARKYGARREVSHDARCVYDTDTALRVRDLLADMFGKQRVIVRIQTDRAPDIERGHVFVCDTALRIEQFVNDTLEFDIGGSVKFGYLTAGQLLPVAGTFEIYERAAMAAEVTRVMNVLSPGLGIACTFSAATGKFTIHGPANLTLLVASGSQTAKAWATLGFDSDKTGPTCVADRAITSALDSVVAYPDPDSDGSWVGKRFVVIETEHALGPATMTGTVVGVSLN